MIEVKLRYPIVIFLVFAVVLTFTLPFFPTSDNIKLILTATTFLFGILAGFVIASRMTRFTRFRDLLTNETGFLISLYEYSQLVEEKFSKKIAKLIDEYIVEGFLYEVYEYHHKTEASFYSIFKELKNFKPADDNQKEAVSQMKWIIRDMPKDREEMYLLEEDKLSSMLKLTLVLLTSIILFCLFYIRTEVWYSYIITIILSTSVFLILLLIKDLDRLDISNYAIDYGIYFRLWDIMEMPRLYTSDAIKGRKLKFPEHGTYRYGIIKRVKGVPFYKEIKTITNK
jgi:membrane protein YdbS with pleckstrin-like domain